MDNLLLWLPSDACSEYLITFLLSLCLKIDGIILLKIVFSLFISVVVVFVHINIFVIWTRKIYNQNCRKIMIFLFYFYIYVHKMVLVFFACVSMLSPLNSNITHHILLWTPTTSLFRRQHTTHSCSGSRLFCEVLLSMLCWGSWELKYMAIAFSVRKFCKLLIFI